MDKRKGEVKYFKELWQCHSGTKTTQTNTTHGAGSTEENNQKRQNVTGGFFGLLTVSFIILKLTGYIDWSWWWVLGPLWIPVVLVITILLIMFLQAASRLK